MNAAERRKLLLENMDQLERQGIDCRACMGTCCTSRCNSMLITELEAQDIGQYLQSQNLWSEEMQTRLKNCVSEFRLDVEIPQHGNRRNLRRSYTCPFYNAGPRGCILPREVKPYGCLGFNPIVTAATGLESGCRSDQDLLLQQELLSTQPLAMDKQPIPVAVLAIATTF